MLTRSFLQDVASILLRADDTLIVPALTLKHAAITQKGEVYGEGDFITSIDVNCEEFLLKELRCLVPDSFAVGEETFDADRDRNIASLSKGYAWILDPLDGTNNVKKYITGEVDLLPRYGVMAALLQDGKPVAGWIVACYQGKRKIACAAEGVGAFIADDSDEAWKKLILTDPTQDPQDLILVTTVKAFPADYQMIIENNMAAGRVKIFDPPPKSAAHELMFIMDGTADAAPFRQFRLWDHMPGLVIIREAGGCVQLLNGEEPDVAKHKNQGILYAPSQQSWHAIRQNLLGNVTYDHTT